MRPLTVTASALIQAPADKVYAIIADYRVGHPSILPKQYFGPLEILKGGIGAGTQLRFQMTAPGMTRKFRSEITEPEPGRVLMESAQVENENVPGSVSTFNVEPEGNGARVTIRTETQVSNWLEGFFTTMFLRQVYAQELKQLAEVVRNRR